MTARATARWDRLIQIIEEMGFRREHSWDDAFRGARRGRRTYWTTHHWVGVGSSYVTLFEGDVRLKVRMSDHAPVDGGGLRYSAVLDDYDRAGDADVSLHPRSPVTLRNVRQYIEAALQRAREEALAEEEEPIPAPRTDAPAVPFVPAPLDPAEAERRERLRADKAERERRAKEQRAAFVEEWQALRVTLTPEHWRRWRQLGHGRPGAKALSGEMGVRPSVLYAALTNGRKW